MRPAFRAPLAAALFALSMLAAGCGGASDPTPEPTTVRDVVEDAARQPTTGFGQVIQQSRDVAGDLESRNNNLDN